MNFGTILDRWEKRRSERGRRKYVAQSENWLDGYPPDAQALVDKDRGDSVRRSETRANWRRKAYQDVLDLHGLTGAEAGREIGVFISSMQKRGFRKGLIIHGKGLHSDGRAILGSLVREYLESSKEVGEFRRAKAKDGGSGATWFLLRQRSR